MLFIYRKAKKTLDTFSDILANTLRDISFN